AGSLISANGGNGNLGGSGAGAGGRIAIYYNSGQILGTLRAYGGAGYGWYYVYAGAGTIFVKNTGEGQGTLIIDNNAHAGFESPLDPTEFDINGSLQFAYLNIFGGGRLKLVPSMPTQLVIPTNVTIDTGGILELGTDQNFNIHIAGDLNLTNGGTIASSVSGDPVNISVAGDLTLQNGGKITMANKRQVNLTVQGNAALLGAGSSIQPGIGIITIAKNITIDSNSSISATGLGYPSSTNTGENGSGPGGGGPGTYNNYGGGGGYGGAGGEGANIGGGGGGITYGSKEHPTDMGSGGYYNGGGGAGGGAIRLTTGGTLQLDGKIMANGNDYSGGVGGGGSGGSVYITAVTLNASAGSLISANGGGANPGGSGAGGGGRIALYYNTGQILSTLQAAGGFGYGGLYGETGTIHTAPLFTTSVGPGGTFADIQSALNASTQSDVIISVTSGTYPSFIINPPATVNSVWIMNAGSGSVNISTLNGPVQILNILYPKNAQLAGLAIGDANGTNPGVVIQNSSGPVVVDQCIIKSGASTPGTHITNSTQVAIQRSALNGAPGLWLDSGSNAIMSRTAVDAAALHGNSQLTTCQITVGPQGISKDVGCSLISLPGIMPNIDFPSHVALGATHLAVLNGSPGNLWWFGYGDSLAWWDLSGLGFDIDMIGLASLETFAIIDSGQWDGTGTFLEPVPIPNNPEIVGRSAVLQMLTLDLSVFSLRWSNAIGIQITN
ncbi:MAG: hypothetical protein HY286_13560, partial [Planctomycetes bacterium]|nr:hypothetical protein [Planctomycetota bacterium]